PIRDNAEAAAEQVTAALADNQALEQEATATQPQDSNVGTVQGREPEAIHSNTDTNPARDFIMAPQSDAGSSESTDGVAPFPPAKAIPRNFLPVRLRWYAVATAGGLLLLFVSIVGSYQLAGIYSAASNAKQAMFAEAPSPSQREPSMNGHLPDALPTLEPLVVEREQLEIALSQPSQEIKADRPPKEASGSAPSSLEADSRQTQPANTSERPQSGSRPKTETLQVTGLSTVRAKPTDRADIIAALEPGSRVRILAKSRDYYHVRSLGKNPIRGYVHREDAFFEKIAGR
ncbi:MAG: hypothetical protein ACREQV_00335, partial [Candidatus Binatia bacterium]